MRTITHHPFKLGSPNLDQRCKMPWLRSLLFWGAIDYDMQGQIWLKKSNFQVLPYWKYITTIKSTESHEYLNCFMSLTVSQSPSSACAHMHRLFHGPDYFTVSTCCTYTNLGSRGQRRSCIKIQFIRYLYTTCRIWLFSIHICIISSVHF